VTDYLGKTYEQLEYTPYGELWVEHVPITGEAPFRFTGKERDGETGLYYFGARYLNPQTSMWLSADPAMGEYVPQAPINDDIRKQNQNLPGMGGVFNYVNLHAYHYAGNNPVKYTDPDGRILRFGSNADSNFKDNYNKAIQYLWKSSTAREIITTIGKDPITFKVSFDTESSFREESLTIYWNPKQALHVKTGGVMSPSIGLIHELLHAYTKTEKGKVIFEEWKQKIIQANQNYDFSKFDWEEEFATYYETVVSTDIGEKAHRGRYDDNTDIDAVAPDPTFHIDP
jgi:RHS repeat-associated protein